MLWHRQALTRSQVWPNRAWHLVNSVGASQCPQCPQCPGPAGFDHVAPNATQVEADKVAQAVDAELAGAEPKAAGLAPPTPSGATPSGEHQREL